MSETRDPLYRGGCQCGALRYALFAEPEQVHLCHCRMCQRAVGNSFAALAPVRHRDLEWTKGAPAEFNSSAKAARGFCANCGTPLYFRYLEGEWIDVTIGSLDSPDLISPKLNYGVESRLSWLATIHDLPDRETSPGGLTGGDED